MRKQELIFKILQPQAEQSGLIFSQGVLECSCPTALDSCARRNTTTCPGPTTSTSPRRRFGALTCAPATPSQGQVRSPKDGERYFALIKVEAINFEPPEESRKQRSCLTTSRRYYPTERLKLETTRNMSGRVMDLMTPMGKGQRGLIVAPPRTGKTMLLQSDRQLDHHQPSRRRADRAAD
jgi:transcription termination factor Rho